MAGYDLVDIYPLAAPPTRPILRLGSKQPREREPKSMAKLRKRVHSTIEGCPIAPRAREGVQDATAAKTRGPRQQP